MMCASIAVQQLYRSVVAARAPSRRRALPLISTDMSDLMNGKAQGVVIT